MVRSACPSVSIVIPACNRVVPLARCLQAIGSLRYPRERMQVIVVDDGSAWSLEEQLGRIPWGFKIDWIRQANAGPAAARNRGAAHACGQLLAFTDDDCQPHPCWLSRLVARYKPGGAAGGRTINVLVGNPYAQVSQWVVSYLYERSNSSEGSRFLASNNLLVPTELFRELGGFNTHYRLPAGEDRDFCMRWCERGRVLAYVPDAVMFHRHPMGPRSFCVQHFRYGCGALRFRQLWPTQAIRPPLKFYFDLVTYPLRQEQRWHRWPLTGLMAVAQAATVAGAGHQWMHDFFDSARRRIAW